MYQFYHNPKCSKSRAALSYLNDNNVTFEMIEYLKKPLSFTQIMSLIGKLTTPSESIIRDKDQEGASNEEIAALIVKTPALLQRPILETEQQAVIARPLENMIVMLTKSK